MTKEIKVTIENRLIMEKRDINVYHSSTRSAHMISSSSSITLPLQSASADDYLHISVVSGPGQLTKKSIVNLPSWADFEFSSTGDVTVVHSGDRMLLTIPPGPPTWQLKMTRPDASAVGVSSDRVSLGNEHPGH